MQAGAYQKNMVRHATPILTPSFLMHGPTALSKKTTSEQESRHISTRIETVSAIGHVDHRFNEYSVSVAGPLPPFLIQATVKTQFRIAQIGLLVYALSSLMNH